MVQKVHLISTPQTHNIARKHLYSRLPDTFATLRSYYNFIFFRLFARARLSLLWERSRTWHNKERKTNITAIFPIANLITTFSIIISSWTWPTMEQSALLWAIFVRAWHNSSMARGPVCFFIGLYISLLFKLFLLPLT